MKKRIMFVCHGNICRSPMAEFIFTQLARERGIFQELTVASSATSSEEIWGGIGNPIYPPAKRVMQKHGIPFTERKATMLTPSDLEKYDMFIGMDSANIRNMKRILGETEKIYKLLDFADGGDVADPWYSGNFDIAFMDIFRGCQGLISYLLEE